MEKDDVQDIVLGEGSLQPQDEKIFLENFQISLDQPTPWFFLQNTIFDIFQGIIFFCGRRLPRGLTNQPQPSIS